MVHDEERAKVANQQWPPIRSLPGAPRPHDFLTKCAAEGGKRIAWPPHLSSTEDLTSDQEGGVPLSHPGQGDHHYNQNEGGPNLTTVYPSGFKLKEEAPMDHSTGAQIVPSQPAFKITQPMKMRGDDKWPPKRSGGEDITQDEVREFIKPKKSNRDYTEFFAQNALPNSYPGYRAPPGTQHHGEEE